MDSQPLVSCLMVTADRSHLARRAMECLARQTWANRELVVVDSGEEDCQDLVEEFESRLRIRYHRFERREETELGDLRNVSLEQAQGQFCIQWDDDEYYHPDRIQVQMEHLLRNDLDAVVLRYTLMHLDSPGFVEKPYRIDGIDGVPGTILHRRTDLRYPNLPRSEDTKFMVALAARGRFGTMVAGSHLFIRCFHGSNTWHHGHFLGKLKRTWSGLFHYYRAKYLQRDLLRHPAFRLTPLEQDTVREFLELSEEFGLIKSER